MEDKKIISVTKEDGTATDAQVLLIFTLEETNKDYIIYSYQEEDNDGMAIVNASIIHESENGYELEGIDDEEEWNKVKDVMRQVIKENKE